MSQSSEEITEGLGKSKKTIGAIDPVLIEKGSFEIIDGKHRKRADPTWPEKAIEIQSPKERILLRMHRNYRRQVSRKETETELLMLADILEEEGKERGKIASELAQITPFGERYIRALLPKKYKIETAPSIKKTELAPSEIRKFEPKEEVSKASGLEPTLNVEVECGTQVATGSQGADAEKTAVTFESAAPAIKPKPPKTVVCPHCHLDLEIVLCSSC